MNKIKDWTGRLIVAALVAAFLFLVFLQAGSASGYRLAVGVDGIHNTGHPFLVAETETFTFLYSQQTGFGVGASYRVGRRGWDAGLGGILLEKTNDLNGTNLNFLFTGGYSWGRYRLGLTHVSNGRKLGIGPDDKSNDGWNLITLGINF